MHKAFSALEEISFCVVPGSTLGIIGENGAGKSTLLKILARTLNPSGGNIEINGRVAALLELGAGFHQELTGRQNIYLNASLMGMTEKEIKYREKDIIGFADIGEFIDRPIKSYSSGMVVRLGFSIATSVDPDILVVDEALSVGDQRFQEKCIERMRGFRKAGKTIILCSHSMYLINELCQEAIWMEKGKIKSACNASRIVSDYLSHMEQAISNISCHESSIQINEVLIKDIETESNEIRDVNSVEQFSSFTVNIRTKSVVDSFKGHISVTFEAADDKAIFSSISRDSVPEGLFFSDQQCFRLSLPCIVLQQGVFWIRVMITDVNAMRIVHEKRMGPVSVVSERPEYGMLWMDHYWEINKDKLNE
ncbi:ABC transporter ATP-binding protein [Desulfonatronovibrio magnus]|uniref:ABC transporter ATP-binding protein n=1 Tax=Desulfonatronovibrio magnus TaxID=698827 RepID=UPI0018DD0A8B|nr:ABC transporter ATP-binding protein [Desulfonatronovibrio magnus]